MKRPSRPVSFVCCYVIALILTPAYCFGQSAEADLTGQPVKLHLTNATLIYALSTLSVDHRVPIGLEYSAADKKGFTLNIEIKDGTLKDALDLIVEQEPAYRWEVRDGVINFVPVRAREPFFEKLLDTRISNFAPRKGLTIFDIRNLLVDLPEVRGLLEASNITVFRYGDYAYRPSIYTKDVDLNISDTNVRGALNKIVRESEHKLWVLGWRTKKKDSLTISF